MLRSIVKSWSAISSGGVTTGSVVLQMAVMLRSLQSADHGDPVGEDGGEGGWDGVGEDGRERA